MQKFTKKTLLVPTSWGELIDKITILQIKEKNIQDQEKLKNVKNELKQLDTIIKKNKKIIAINLIIVRLKEVNQKLWKIEDKIRKKEILKEFDEEFIKLARSVYKTNDQRAALKKEINLILNSDLVEEKSYQK